MHIFWKANEAYVAMVTNAAWVREITFSEGEGTEQGNEKVVILLLMSKNAFLNISFREKKMVVVMQFVGELYPLLSNH